MTNARYGHVKGEPVRFVRGHGRRRPIQDRFWEKVERQGDGCWRWTGSRVPKGYGNLIIDGRGSGRVYAHRLSYELHKGPIPDGLHIDHLCRNPWCVNPAHLEAVSVQTNVRRQRTTKLAAVDAAAIRESSETNADLARRYGVDPSIVSRIRAGIAWRT